VPLELEGELLAPVGCLVLGTHQHVVEEEEVTQLSHSLYSTNQNIYFSRNTFPSGGKKMLDIKWL
jgi:hypothetical protein